MIEFIVAVDPRPNAKARHFVSVAQALGRGLVRPCCHARKRDRFSAQRKSQKVLDRLGLLQHVAPPFTHCFPRRAIIVNEANALSTAYLRADAIAEPQRGELKATLKEYTADRVTLLSREGRDQIEALLAKVGGLHERMWRSAIDGTRDNAPLMAVVLPPINEVIDLHSTHLAMARRHLPIPIMAVLLGTVAISVGMMGFGNGRVGRRFSLLDAIYGAALATALWMTIDLDYPGIGIIRVSNRAVVEALAAMN